MEATEDMELKADMEDKEVSEDMQALEETEEIDAQKTRAEEMPTKCTETKTRLGEEGMAWKAMTIPPRERITGFMETGMALLATPTASLVTRMP